VLRITHVITFCSVDRASRYNRVKKNRLDAQLKGKAFPSQAWSGPDGSRKLRFPDFMTTAQGGGKVVSLTHRPPLPPENTPGIHFC
jgi:predicted DNA-binding transcriptional regulator AlpA